MSFLPSAFTALPIFIHVIALVSGMVRGFTGFGSALTFVPITASLIGPQAAVATIVLLDACWQAMLWRDAWTKADRAAIAPVMAGALVGAPIGVTALALLEPTLLRWGIAIVVLSLLGLLVSGWRLKRPLGRLGSAAVGLASGFFNGAATLGGLVAATFWLAGRSGNATIRASLVLYLMFLTVFALINLSIAGILTPERALAALPLLPAYGTGVWLGARLFNTVGGAAAYRPLAYLAVALGALASLPALDALLRG